jgi:hypothetical protein
MESSFFSQRRCGVDVLDGASLPKRAGGVSDRGSATRSNERSSERFRVSFGVLLQIGDAAGRRPAVRLATRPSDAPRFGADPLVMRKGSRLICSPHSLQEPPRQ